MAMINLAGGFQSGRREKQAIHAMLGVSYLDTLMLDFVELNGTTRAAYLS
jgi:hypothetical protein